MVNDRKLSPQWLVTAAVVTGTLCIGLTMSMLNLAVPLMIAALDTDVDTIQWIITGPMLVNVALVPAVGWLTQFLGSRRVYVWSLIIWMATALPCGLSDTVGGVIFYRLLQGVGGSLHIPTVLTVMYQAFPLRQRGLAMGLQQGAQWAATAVGMTLGGHLLQVHGWRGLFFYPIPLGLLSIALAHWAIPNRRLDSQTRLDWGGLATLTPALTLWLLAVSQSQQPGFDSWDVLQWVGAGLFCAAAFAYIEARQHIPLIDFGLFRVRTFSAATVVYWLNTFTSMGMGFAVIVFLQHLLHYSPLQVGIVLLPATLVRVPAEMAAGHLSDRWGARGLSIAGLLGFAIACAALGQVDQHANAWWVAMLLILANVGLALSNSPILHAALQTLREDRIEMGSGLLSLIRIIGGTFGVGVVGPLVASTANWGQSAGATILPTTALLVGYQHYFGLMALLSLCTMLPTLWVRAPRCPTEP